MSAWSATKRVLGQGYGEHMLMTKATATVTATFWSARSAARTNEVGRDKQRRTIGRQGKSPEGADLAPFAAFPAPETLDRTEAGHTPI